MAEVHQTNFNKLRVKLNEKGIFIKSLKCTFYAAFYYKMIMSLLW